MTSSPRHHRLRWPLESALTIEGIDLHFESCTSVILALVLNTASLISVYSRKIPEFELFTVIAPVGQLRPIRERVLGE